MTGEVPGGKSCRAEPYRKCDVCMRAGQGRAGQGRAGQVLLAGQTAFAKMWEQRTGLSSGVSKQLRAGWKRYRQEGLECQDQEFCPNFYLIGGL